MGKLAHSNLHLLSVTSINVVEFLTLPNSATERHQTKRIYKKKRKPIRISAFSASSGARTLDPNIKSVVLYQLS